MGIMTFDSITNSIDCPTTHLLHTFLYTKYTTLNYLVETELVVINLCDFLVF